MKSILAGLRQWRRWRLQRNRVHIPGIAEFRIIGTALALEQGSWRIEDDEGRNIFVDAACDSAVDIHVGDRLECEPLPPYSRGWAIPARGWRIIRKLDPQTLYVSPSTQP